MPNGFQRAVRTATRLRLGLEAPSGGGKTWTALKIATALADHDNGRVGLIDSERMAASKYAEGRPFDFDTYDLSDKSPSGYVAALAAASAAGFAACVVDSGSHEWKGVLRVVDQAASRMQGNTWAGWSRGRPAHEEFVDALLAMPCHMIVTFRSKQESEQVKEGGKTTVKKLGLAPVTADDMDYEFDVWGSMDMEHSVTITKSRIDTIPVGECYPLGDGIAEAYIEWIGGAAYAEPPKPAAVIQQEVRNATIAAGVKGSSVVKAAGQPFDANAIVKFVREHGVDALIDAAREIEGAS